MVELNAIIVKNWVLFLVKMNVMFPKMYTKSFIILARMGLYVLSRNKTGFRDFPFLRKIKMDEFV